MSKNRKLLLFFAVLLLATAIIILPRFTKFHIPVPRSNPTNKEALQELNYTKSKAVELKSFCFKNNFSTQFAFILNMKQHSGKKRFYVYDFLKDTIIEKGLVAHGSCNTIYLTNAQFSNKIGCGCSAFGKYKVGYEYTGRFGKAYKLYGLDTSNNNAFERNIVLHSYSCVPNDVTYPQPICNSLGCAMVSENYISVLSSYIRQCGKKQLVKSAIN